MGDAGDGSEPLPRIEIRVKDPGNCPVLEAGGRMVYAHPEVLKAESDRICAQALVMLAPAAEEMARAAASGGRTFTLSLTCSLVSSGRSCGARFELSVMSPEETAGPAGTTTLSGRRGVTRDATAPAASRQTETVAPASRPGRPLPRSESRTITRRIESGVASAPFLSRLDPEVVREIVTSSTVRRFPEPAAFIQEGQEGEALYIIGEGKVEVVRHSDDGHEVVLAELGKGHCLGEMSLVTGQPASATVRTRGENVAVLVLARETFENLLGRHPDLHREFSRIIAERLYSMNVKLETQSSRGIAGRLTMIGVVDLVQTLQASRRTGSLTLRDTSGREARVGFREGEVVSAVVGETPGAEGFYEIVTWQKGDFSFQGGEPEPDPSGEAAVGIGTMALLMEGMRRLDEKGAGR